MREASDPAPSQGAQNSAPIAVAKRNLMRLGLYGCLVVALISTGYLLVRANQEQAAMKAGQSRLLLQHGVNDFSHKNLSHKRLASDYVDKDGGMIADPPVDPKRLIDPESLTVAYYVGDEDETVLVDWKGFEAHLEQATGKQVICQEYLNASDEIASIKAGEIQVVALHAADTPYLVNNAGFVPVAVLGSESGPNGNHLNLAVSAKGNVKSLADLRGKELICTRPDSITGYRAAIAVLLHETNMRPDVDYNIRYSHGQKRSITGLVAGEFEAAALSDDKVQSLLSDGTIQKSDYRVIYESQVIPRLTIGYVHLLRPELAAAVAKALLGFTNDGATPDVSTGKPLRFMPIDYKRDFEFVQKIDDAFDPRFGQRNLTESVP